MTVGPGPLRSSICEPFVRGLIVVTDRILSLISKKFVNSTVSWTPRYPGMLEAALRSLQK